MAARRFRAALRLGGGALPPARGRVLVSLAWAESERGRVELGFRLLDEAEPLLPPEGRALLHGQRALLLHRVGRHEPALAEFDRAVAGLGPHSLDLVKALNNRSMLHLDAGRAGPARDDLRRGLRIARRNGLTLVTALLRVNAGCLDVVAGDLPAALGAFAAARRDYERVAPGRLPALAVERARALVAAGLFGEADRELAAAVARSGAQGQDHGRADALQVRAEAALLAGRPAAAGEWAAAARSDFRRRGNRRRAALAELLSLRAAHAELAAGRDAGHGLWTTPENCRTPMLNSAPPTRAGEARDRPLWTKPENCHTPMLESAPPNRAGVARAPAAGRDGEMSVEGRGGAAAFEELAGRARRLAGELRRFGLAEDARVALLVAARATVPRSPRAAAGLVERAGTPGRLDRLDTRLLWRLARAEVATAAGRAADAQRQLAAGMEALHRYRGRFGCLDLQTGASAHGRDLASAGLAGAMAAGSVDAVFRWAERGRAQALRLPPVRPPDDPEVAEALEDLRQTRQALRAAEIAGRPATGLRGRAEVLQRRIRESAWSARGSAGGPTAAASKAVHSSVGGAAVVSPAAVRASLGGAVLVTYLRVGETLHALVVGDKAGTLRPVGPMAVAEEAVLRLRADLDTVAGRAMPARLAAAVGAATRRDAEVLQAALLDPILPLIGDREIVVVPTGLLITTPWGMLPACAGRPLTVAPSATAWLAARERSAHERAAHERAGQWAHQRAGQWVHQRAGEVAHEGAGEGAAEGTHEGAGVRAVLVGGPEIARAGEEIAAVGRIWGGGATMLSGAAATPGATLAALDGAGIAHLAAHGRHEAENPLFSALDLAGGPLLGYDLQRLGKPPGVVVLASCELGLTEVRPGDETFGMASALLAAGTVTVVASVGRVADEAATDVMVGFHRGLAGGQPPAVALAAVAGGTGFVCLGG